MDDTERERDVGETPAGGGTGDGEPEDGDDRAGGLPLSRRDLLVGGGLALALGGAGVGAYTYFDGTWTDPGEHVPFTVFEEVREAVRAGPGHLPARADVLVAADDPAALFEFVRDEIVTYPPERGRVNASDEAMRWGVRGTLRGGAGTPREKAELLADLYRRAGFEAEVLGMDRLVADRTAEEAAVQDLLWRPVDRAVAPDVAEEVLADWADRLGLSGLRPTGDRTVSGVDVDGRESRDLAGALYERLPEDRRAADEFDWRWGGTPVVRVVVDGETRFANLFTPGVPFGEVGAGVEPDRLQAVPEPELPTVAVTLSAATAAEPDEPFDLVSGEWSLGDLVGRQLLVGTPPGVDPFEHPEVTFRDVRTFLPTLTVQAPDLDPDEMAALSVVGDAVTRSGDRLRVGADGTVHRNDRPLVAPEPAAGSADVASLRVEADSARFPEVRLNVFAHDAAGRPVEGLPATAFDVRDEGSPVGVALTATRAVPRVRILSDTSISMPQHYRDEGMTALVERLREHVLAAYPGAEIVHEETSSDIWTALGAAAATDANLIVYATDGHVNDERTPEIAAALAGGPPAFMLSVYDDLEDERLREMADRTGGRLVAASDHDAAETAILAYLDERVPDLPTYVLTYGSPGEAETGDERTVDVGLAGGNATATGRYTVPAQPALPPNLARLALTVTVGRESVTRTLAGYDPARHDGEVTRPMLDDVAGALFGHHYLSFEGAAPPFSVWFDDLLGAKLSVAGLDRALQADDSEALDRERARGYAHVPPDLFAVAGPLPDAVTEDSLTYQDGPRVTLYQERPAFGTSHVVRHVDLLPFAGFATAAADGEEAFRLTLERTARLAVLEDARFETTTRSLLGDRDLVEVGAVPDDSWDRDRERRWHRLLDPYDGRDYQLVSDDGTFPSLFVAFWNVDYETGELTGVLGDGSGGGTSAERIAAQIREIDRVVSMLNLMIAGVEAAGALAGPGAFALGVVAAYGQTLARLYGAASLAVAIMNASGLGEEVVRALALLACNVAKSIAFALADDWVTPMVENLLGAAGLSSPLSCPG